MGNRSLYYQSQLIKELQDPQEAAAYLEAAMEDGTTEEFLLALRNVAEAKGLLTTSQETNSGLTQKPGFSTKNLDLSRSIQVRNPVSRVICVSPII